MFVHYYIYSGDCTIGIGYCTRKNRASLTRKVNSLKRFINHDVYSTYSDVRCDIYVDYSLYCTVYRKV